MAIIHRTTENSKFARPALVQLLWEEVARHKFIEVDVVLATTCWPIFDLHF